MRPVFIAPLLFLFLSCEKNKNAIAVPDKSAFPERWELVEMRGSQINAEPLRGEGMAWQSRYIFHKDGSFQKFRMINGDTISAQGTFKWTVIEDRHYMELSYTSGKELIESCSRDTDTLLYGEGGTLITSWEICDGPFLVYKPVSE
tara:strand:+ start:186603 stop:187040 length:438 start_codon:yes stop_codon:yes gene_type:complete